jgi:hypothetical protein
LSWRAGAEVVTVNRETIRRLFELLESELR